MEISGLAIYGKLNEKEEAFMLASVGHLEVNKQKTNDYLIRYYPLRHSRELPELELEEYEIWDIAKLDVVYVDFEEIKNYDFIQGAPILIIYLKDGSNRIFAYDNSEKGQFNYKQFKNDVNDAMKNNNGDGKEFPLLGEKIILKEEPKIGWEKPIFGSYNYSERNAELYITNYRIAIVSPNEENSFWKDLLSDLAVEVLEQVLDENIPTYKPSKAPSSLFSIPLQAIQVVRIKKRTMLIVPTTEISLLFSTSDGRKCISFFWDYGFTTNAKEFILGIGNKILDACLSCGAELNSIDKYDHYVNWD